MSEHRNRGKRGFRHEGHRLVTRRDFLGQGLISGAALVTAPSLLGLLGGSKASAQVAADCGIATGGAGKIPFICFDLAGGANHAGSNVLVGGPGGQLDPIDPAAYEMLGLPPGMYPTDPGQVNTDLGLAFHSDSAFLRGIIDRTSAATRANTNGTVICAVSDNDTDNNPHNPMYGINKAGADGDLVALIGTENSDSGGNSRAPMLMIDPSVRPTKVDRPSDSTGLVDTGKLTELLEPDDAAAVMAAVENISALKVDKVSEEAMVKNLISCAYTQSSDLVARYGDPTLLNPELDPEITGNGGIFSQQELDNQSKFRKTASVMKLVVNGFAGAGTCEFGGYDYHDSTRATGEIRDFQAGQCMGAVLEYAARLQQQVMVYVFSDGSVFSDGNGDPDPQGRGKLIWKGDRSSTSAVFILVYDPAGRPQLMSPDKAQIGYFRPNGSVETASTRVAASVNRLAEAIVLNYMALHDDVGLFDQALPGHGLGMGADLDALIAFQPIRTG